MKRRIWILLMYMVLTFAAAEAEPVDYKLNVQNFCELTVVDGVKVNYVCNPDSAGWAVFTSEPDLASHIMFENNAEKLTIQTDADEKPIEGIPTVTVYSASLRRCENSGDSLLTVDLSVPVAKFKARQIGNGSIVVHGVDTQALDAGITAGCGSLTIDGKAGRASFSNVGTGPIDASHLESNQVKCLVFGSGDVKCQPTGQLKVFGAGSGSVFYYTTPSRIINRSIGVKAKSVGEGKTQTNLLSEK